MPPAASVEEKPSGRVAQGDSRPPSKANSNLENESERQASFSLPPVPDNSQLESLSTIQASAIPVTPKDSKPLADYESGFIYVEFEENDARNPVNMSYARKWVLTMVACGSTGVAASAAADLVAGFPSMIQDLDCSREQAALMLAVYSLGFAIAPLITAPISEELGRLPMYFGSGIISALAHLMAALGKNATTVVLARFMGGVSGSTGATLVGGTIADIWAAHERGTPMATFALVGIGSGGLGVAAAGWVEQNHNLGWRWIQWIHLIISVIHVVVVLLLFKETRGGAILTREAQKLRAETGDSRYRARAEDETSNLRRALILSCTRPLYILFTEPVAASFSLWIGFAWGVLFSEIASISTVFVDLHHFSNGQLGLAYLPLFLGAFLGFISNFYQERLYAKHVRKAGPEARLYLALVAAALLPIGCFIYAWTSSPGVHWIGPMIGVTVFSFSLYTMYVACFSYLSDAYTIYASSALAAQSLFRNLMGTGFPLFTDTMYSRLGFNWASSVFGFIALALAVVPFVLFSYGPRLRAKSKFASELAKRAHDH